MQDDLITVRRTDLVTAMYNAYVYGFVAAAVEAQEAPPIQSKENPIDEDVEIELISFFRKLHSMTKPKKPRIDGSFKIPSFQDAIYKNN
ncbi:hypothetical protein [Delftia tsuruhatensis]|uniref:Uncharacterized protein n=1 Tax=Delftia tsuruhatensis TaxID=180282 RepID=A0ABM6E531_9BURK|nr:hypothetical protein [Delftia tsuruhatensis]AOV02389.1 hypothetical protein BI380_14110 [Delftia tsuruhatensis]